MRKIALACLLVLSSLQLLQAADDPIAAFKAAMQSDDSVAKKEAIHVLASRSVGSDDEVLPLLIQAVSDRQASEIAIQALRARTGLVPAAKKGAGGYPAYPSSDSPADWQAWLAARAKDREQDELKKKIEEDEKKAEEKAAAPAPAATESKPAESQPVVEEAPPTDFGKLDRIVFKSGSMLLGYIVNKRTDADGNLISIRIVHQDQGGEETLSADLIARIDEDIR